MRGGNTNPLGGIRLCAVVCEVQSKRFGSFSRPWANALSGIINPQLLHLFGASCQAKNHRVSFILSQVSFSGSTSLRFFVGPMKMQVNQDLIAILCDCTKSKHSQEMLQISTLTRS